MLTEDQIAELRKLYEKTPTGEKRWMTHEEVIQAVDAVPALLAERALLVKVAEAVELVLCPSVESGLTLDERRYMLFAALAAWRVAREGIQPAKAVNAQPTAADPLPEITPENFFTRVFHDRCPTAGTSGIMKRHPKETLTIEDGSVLTLWECLHCGVKVYAGLDNERRIVRRAARDGERMDTAK